jgi:DNA-directed RNA polymerase specialized sigma24 family protein
MVLLIVFAGASVFGIMVSTLLALRVRKLTRLVALQAADAECMAAAASPGDFTPALRRADLHVRLQQGWQRREPPEKYRFINSLTEHGVPAAEIARILGLAAGEVEQLVTLARVARRQPLPKAKGSRPKKGRALINTKDFPPPAETVVSVQ